MATIFVDGMMATNITSALQAYNQAAKSFSIGDVASGEQDSKSVAGPSFASFMEMGAKSAVETIKAGEEQSKMAIAGKADIRDVVLAVNNAEVTLQTVVAVRDKVVSAYNDILKMAI